MRIEELSETHQSAFLEMISDYKGHEPFWLTELRSTSGWTAKSFLNLLKSSALQRFDWRPPAGKTSLSRYVMLDSDGRIVANALLRFPLDEASELRGGNILVDVPPSLRRKGHGSYCMALTLFEAVRAGLRGVFVSCAADDTGAKKMIELNRGQLHATIVDPSTEQMIVQYWIRFE